MSRWRSGGQSIYGCTIEQRRRRAMAGSSPSHTSAVCTATTNAAPLDSPSAPDETDSRPLSPPSSGRALPTLVDLSVGPMPAGPGNALNPAGNGAGTARAHQECIPDRVFSSDRFDQTPPTASTTSPTHRPRLRVARSCSGTNRVYPRPPRAAPPRLPAFAGMSDTSLSS
jgi:hypothetical protein